MFSRGLQHFYYFFSFKYTTKDRMKSSSTLVQYGDCHSTPVHHNDMSLPKVICGANFS